MSKKENRIKLEHKLAEHIKECPRCGAALTRGYLVTSHQIAWGEELNAIGGVKTNTKRIAGLLTPVNQLPSLMCEKCGIIVSQFR